MSNKVIHAVFDDDDVLLKAVKDVRNANYTIEEVYTPFPVHGLEKAMGLKNTRIAITSFIYGLMGLAFAVWMMNYMMIQDWPQNIGGKPSFTYYHNMPAFVPIMFELTVFFAAHLMVITFYLRSKLGPFVEAKNPDPRTTDDKFLMEVSLDGDEKQMADFLTKAGAIETKVVDRN